MLMKWLFKRIYVTTYYILLFGTAMVFDDNKENTYIQYIHTSDLLLAVKIVSANKCLSNSYTVR